MAQTVVGIFNSYANAQNAVDKLNDIGISTDNIDISSSNSSSSDNVDLPNTFGANTTGAPMATTMDATGTEGGGIGHFFRSLFSDDEETSDKYSTVAQKSGTVVTVHAQSSEQAEDAADILDDCGAVDVDESAASYGVMGNTGTTGKDFPDSDSTGKVMDTMGSANSIPIIEESMEVGKKEVQTGGVRLRSRIVERPVEESLRLRQEKVNVQRTSVDRPATSADFDTFADKNIEMVETTEVPVISKAARVVEEVSLGKEVTERTETVSDTVRKTEVDVEDLGTTDVKGNTYN